MLAYMALIINSNTQSFDSTHAQVYREIKENIPNDRYVLLTSGNKRSLRAKDPKAFYELLPLYAVKPIYIQLASFFYTLGFSLTLSTVLPSILAYILIGVLILIWLKKYSNGIWSVLFGLLIMSSGLMVNLSKLSSPDCQSAFFLLSALYFIIIRPSLALTLLAFTLAISTRLDNIIPASIIVTFLYFSKSSPLKLRLPVYVASIALFMGVYFVITMLVVVHPYNWSVSYYPSFIRYMNLSGEETRSFSITAYIQLAISQLFTALLYSNFVLFLIILSLVIYSRPFSIKTLSFPQKLSLILLLVILTRFVFFPDLTDRFNAAYYVFFLLILVKRFTEKGFSTHHFINKKT
jgi:hypothetical protein